jgi:small subunit ribosomal protein S20
MPNTASAKKRVRQGDVRAFRNKLRRTSMRSSIRKLREAIEAGDKAAAQTLLLEVQKRIDKTAQTNIIHEKNASNQKSKLTKLVNNM